MFARVPQPLSHIFQSLSVWLATGLGIGLVAPAPGNAGAALWGLPLAWLMGRLPGAGWQVLVILLLLVIGVLLCTVAGHKLGDEKDNQAIVWDEIATVPLVFVLVPLSNWRLAVAGFLLHRLLDITKPPPAGWMESLPDGLGVMADDVAAAIYAGLCLAGLAWLDNWTGWKLLAASSG